MKKFNRHFFVTVVILIALSVTLTGCGKKKNPPITEVIVDETSIPTQEIVTQTVEPIESSNPTIEPITTVNGNNTVSTEAYITDGEVINSRKFSSYWDYENNTFDLEEYLKSTNPNKITILDDDITGFPESYAAIYDNNWYVAVRQGIILISISGSGESGIYINSVSIYEVEDAKPIWLDKYYRLSLTNFHLPSVEIAVNTVKAHSNAKTFEEMKGYLDQVGQKSEIEIFD